MSLYPPPKIIETEVFAEVPAAYRKEGVYSKWSAANNKGETIHSFIEGPSFDRDGNLYIVDIPWGRVFRVSPRGDFDVVAEYDGEPNGLKIHKDGRIFIADYKNGIMLLDPASGAVTPHCDRYRVEGLKGVNDLVFAMNGDMYFTDQGLTGLHDPTGRVYRLRPDGHLDQLINTGPSPNGIVLDPSEQWLAHAAPARRRHHQGGRLRPAFRRQRPGRHGHGRGGKSRGLPRRRRPGLGVQPARRAALPHKILPRPVPDERGLRRTGQPDAVHDGIGYGDDFDGGAAGGGGADVWGEIGGARNRAKGNKSKIERDRNTKIKSTTIFHVIKKKRNEKALSLLQKQQDDHKLGCCTFNIDERIHFFLRLIWAQICRQTRPAALPALHRRPAGVPGRFLQEGDI
jgi:hypothetical protein